MLWQFNGIQENLSHFYYSASFTTIKEKQNKEIMNDNVGEGEIRSEGQKKYDGAMVEE